MKNKILLLLLAASLCMSGCNGAVEYADVIREYEAEFSEYQSRVEEMITSVPSYASMEEIPAYDGNIFVVIEDNVPGFTEEVTDVAYEYYSELDVLGRCGPAEACVGQEIMPTEERGPIGQIKPTGWHTIKYNCVDGKYLYNIC